MTYLNDPLLFGNDAGEEEDIGRLLDYFFWKPEFERFFVDKTKLCVARSRKGMGKSALLSVLAHRKAENKTNIVINIKGNSFNHTGEFSSKDPSILINQWKTEILAQINLEIGARIRVAITDDEIRLVESSELEGFRGKNIVSTLTDRINFKLQAKAAIPGVGEIGGEISRAAQAKMPVPNYRFTNRNLPKQATVWLIVDDIDATFTSDQTFKISTFFSACRELVQHVTGLRIRASIRSDVWSYIDSKDEALDKVRQYMLPISWTREDNLKILIQKVFTYLKENHESRLHVNKRNREILYYVFEREFQWDGRKERPEEPILILSSRRPRWAGQLCRMAGEKAATFQERRISDKHIIRCMEEFGGYRLSDLYKEHTHQMPDLNHFIQSFAEGNASYSKASLIEKIHAGMQKYVDIHKVLPKIDGVDVSRELDIAHFLYKCDFICGYDPDRSIYYTYDANPDYLKGISASDDSLTWIIHSSYRNRLRIRDN